MKLTTFTLLLAMMAVGTSAQKAAGQNPDAIDNARSVAKSLQQQQATGRNGAATPAAKPAPGAPAAAVKPAVIPGDKPAATPAPKAAKASAAASAQHDQLQRVNVVPGSNDIQVEISSSSAVTPKVTKLSAPNRLLLELPDTVVATAQNKIPVGSGGVKGVRIGMDGKTPPTTSVVVDLEKPLSYDIAPGPAGKVVLILHTQDAGTAVAKAPAPAAKTPAPATKTPAPAVQVQASAKPATAPKVADVKTPAGKPVAAPAVAVAKSPMTPQAVVVATGKPGTPAPVPVAASKSGTPAPKVDPKAQAKTTVVAAKPAPAPAPVAVAVPPAKPEAAKQPKPEEKKWAMTGRRDPFFSPVVQTAGSGCSTGKKCLEIGSINLRGVVKSDTGFIAVVTNNLGKAYFLRENDPVFNGYVVKITGDSVTFQETLQDKLGKSFTREVVKRIFTPAV